MIDFDSIWRTQDEIRTVVNAVLGALDHGRLLPAGRKNASGTWPMMKDVVPSFLNCLLPLKKITVSDLCCQFPIPADYDGVGSRGTKFVFYL